MAAPAENQKLDEDKVKYFEDEIKLKMLQNEVAKEMALTKPLSKPIENNQPDPAHTSKHSFSLIASYSAPLSKALSQISLCTKQLRQEWPCLPNFTPECVCIMCVYNYTVITSNNYCVSHLYVYTEKSCFDDGVGSLNEWSLEHLINTVSPNTFVNAPMTGNSYYATIDYGRSLNFDSDPLRVLFSSSLGLNQSPPPDKVLLNFPPYANTSLYFIGTFGNSEHKPAIGILGMFGSDTLSMTIDRLKCIAKLKYMGFKLIPWNIDDFKASVNDACDNRIEQAVSSNGFTNELTIVEKLIEFVTEMSQNPNVQNWCLTTPTVLANVQSHVKMRY